MIRKGKDEEATLCKAENTMRLRTNARLYSSSYQHSAVHTDCPTGQCPDERVTYKRGAADRATRDWTVYGIAVRLVLGHLALMTCDAGRTTL
jgi:hypothetical protein